MNGAPGIPGGVFKFDSNGDQVADAAFAHIQDGKSTKGLEITSDQTMVYAARESYVEAFSLNSTGLYSVKSWPLPQGNSPNGICLSDDDNVLYVTDAGYSMNTTGIYPGPTRGGVWAIDSDDNLLQIWIIQPSRIRQMGASSSRCGVLCVLHARCPLLRCGH